MSIRTFFILTFLTLGTFLLSGCGSSNENEAAVVVPESKYDLSYEGLTFYYPNQSPSQSRLPQLSDERFNALEPMQKLQVADTLLSSLFFAYTPSVLDEKIATGTFIEDIRNGLSQEHMDVAALETEILDDEIFRQENYPQESVEILSRFYAMDTLDRYYFNNWSAYILTQTIMFSPAYELDSSHSPNIARVYNRLVSFLEDESGMRYTSYVHMMSEDNWRRFRSPEDNGREMMEIFMMEQDDAKVPLAAKALQNWKLDRDNDTLVVGRNENSEPIDLFGITIYNGDDFYREMVKSAQFQRTVTTRLVSFFFPNASSEERASIISSIVSSDPETFQDILQQILFSEAYLLHNRRAKSAEELFFSLAKKTEFRHHRNTFAYFKEALDEMHQASMKYKLGKRVRVPLDTLSFANYHQYIREEMLLRQSNPDKIDDYDAWSRQGWDKHFVDNSQFDFDRDDELGSFDAFVSYLFKSTIMRAPKREEMTLFKEHMFHDEEGTLEYNYSFDMFYKDNNNTYELLRRERNKKYIATIVLDYISRLERFYMQEEVE